MKRERRLKIYRQLAFAIAKGSERREFLVLIRAIDEDGLGDFLDALRSVPVSRRIIPGKVLESGPEEKA